MAAREAEVNTRLGTPASPDGPREGKALRSVPLKTEGTVFY